MVDAFSAGVDLGDVLVVFEPVLLGDLAGLVDEAREDGGEVSC